MRIVSVKLPKELDSVVTTMAKRRRVSRSAIVREAIVSYARMPQRSMLEVAGNLVGCLQGPRDASTNPKYLEGFGE